MSGKDEPHFDVYAKVFIPQFLQDIIGIPPRQVVPTISETFEIDYKRYICTFAGSLFLPDRKPNPEASPFVAQGNSFPDSETVRTGIAPWKYRWAFQRALAKELEAVKVVQNEFSLYKVPIPFRCLDPSGSSLLGTINIPGLGENSPFIRLGDILIVRPLHLDLASNPVAFEVVSYNNQTFYNSYPVPGWNGNEFHAVVMNINRPREVVNIRMDIAPGSADDMLKRFVFYNVMIPFRATLESALQRAADTASEILISSNEARSGDQQTHTPTLNSAGASPQRQTSPKELVVNEELSKLISTRQRGPKNWLSQMMFPDPVDGAYQKKLNPAAFSFKPYDRQLNFEQLKAVDSIRQRNYGDVPFLVSGPPGTGKTKTTVEAALQLLNQPDIHHILVCAPSDPAADTLAKRLKEYLNPHEMLRLNSASRTFAEVPPEIMSYCCIDGDSFSLPPFDRMMKLRVIVVTCRDADMLVQARLTNRDLYEIERGFISALYTNSENPKPRALHWRALLIDEAAQATEPEALVPLTVVTPPSDATNLKMPQFVMAGDHKQLGPRTASKSPDIEMSLFERLLERPLYSKHPLARHKVGRRTSVQVLTKAMLPILRPPFSNLIRNYRSHPAILAIPNFLFYHDTLLAEAADTEALLSWSGWKGRRWPVLFSCNTGSDEVEHEGGGWYNVTEAQKACRHALSLLQSSLVTRHEDICVMSPFQAQVRRLRSTFRAVGLGSVNIGPVEAFQGLESRVVILCTTRSRIRFMEQDKVRGLGIVHEPKRFNVAMTRAKQGLVVIGNPAVLEIDSCWKPFLEFCRRNKLWELEYGMFDDRDRSWKQSQLDQTGWRNGPTMPALESALRFGEDVEDRAQLGQVASYDDEMWVRGIGSALPSEIDYEDDLDEEVVETSLVNGKLGDESASDTSSRADEPSEEIKRAQESAVVAAMNIIRGKA